MARPDQVQDPTLRGLMAAAREAYLGDRNQESVEQSLEAFRELLRRQPDFLTSGPFAGNNRRVFPQLGVSLKGERTPAPELVFERRQFSNPEAITYFEYVSDCLVAAKL
ncbi:MAG: hypothetical protein ACRDJE_29890 [Dehalococcoidia bacterium]